MQILDEDMQMVRSWLEEAKAPEYIKGHFENLVDQHAKESDRVEELEGEVRDLENNESDEIEKLGNRIGELEDELDEINGDGMRSALETVKYWLLDVLVHGRPMQKPPRQILRIVEGVL